MPSVPDNVIATKLVAPLPPWGLVARARLCARLDGHPARVVLLSAPAGFGKTALVLDWLGARASSVAWLSLDRSDNDPTRFFNHLGAAVARLPGAGAARAASLLQRLGQGAGMIGEAQEAFGALGGDAVVVLDDLHEVEEPKVLRALEALLPLRPDAPRLLLLTRVDPPLPLGRLRLNGALLELREQDLRFTAEECAALFGALLPGALDAAQVRQLEQRTEGWAAGLRLAAIALHDVADRAAAVASFAGSHRLIVDYLVEEALEQQSAQVQQFLMDTSVLERFTPETCAAVTGQPDARECLARIEAASLFLVPLGSERRWFRYHHLFRELLQFRLRRLQPERAELLHRRASLWFEQQGDTHAAIEHACQLRDRQRLLELLDAHGFEILASSQLATFARWLEHVPDALAEPWPVLIVSVGWLRVLTQRAPDLQAVFAAAEAALANVPPTYAARTAAQARLRLDVLRGFEARFAGRFREALLVSRAALQDVPEEEPFTRGLLTYNLARLETIMGRTGQAVQLLERAFEDNLRAGTNYLLLTGMGQTAAARLQLEGVTRAREEIQTSLAFAQQRHLTGLPAFSAVLYHQANVEYVADRLDEADAAAARALELGLAGNFPEGYGNGLMLRARIASARGALADAEALLTELAALARNGNLVLLDTTVALEQARLAGAREQAGGPAAPHYEPAPEDDCWTTFRESEAALCLWQALRARDHARARDLAATLLRESEARGRGVACCIALLGHALLPEPEQRWDYLERALQLAARNGYVRPLIEAADLVRPLLQAALSRSLSADARACARLLLEHAGRSEVATPPATTPLEPLTSREADVLAYLCQGLSNKAIARVMFVSAETVKTHLKHIYWKLGAATREDAVARARELRIPLRPHVSH